MVEKQSCGGVAVDNAHRQPTSKNKPSCGILSQIIVSRVRNYS